MRQTLADKAAPDAERRCRLRDFLRDTGDTGSAAEFASLLDDDAFRAAAIPLLARFNDAAVGEKLTAKLGGNRQTNAPPPSTRCRRSPISPAHCSARSRRATPAKTA
ncbi:MAG: hypothetical protein R3F11_04740 [Verrucomicrobiales bacterium]